MTPRKRSFHNAQMKSEFWQRLRAARRRANLTQQDVADAFGISRVAVSQWESPEPSKRTQPEPDRWQLLARITGHPVSWLLDNEADPDVAPISHFDATFTDDSVARSQRVILRGVAMIDVDGFWKELEESGRDVPVQAITQDPDAYALRIVGRRYHPSIESGQCILLEPNAPLRVGKRVLIQLADGRHAVRSLMGHEDGLWIFTSLTDANDVLELRDDQVLAAHRVTSNFDLD